MATDRKLINYLPRFMQEYAEMRKIMDTEQIEIDTLWSKTDDVLSDQFIMDATEIGVIRWESMLGISPKDTDSLDERKFRILTRLNQELPYTLTKLKEALIILCGSDGFSINLQAAQYHIEIQLAIENSNDYQEVTDLLTKMLPANMTQYVTLMYNTNAKVGMFSHAQLTNYTHESIRSEVLNDA